MMKFKLIETLISSAVSTYAQEAKDDLPYINKYKDKIISAANNCNVPPSVVAGIISRETRGGRGAGFTSDGWGDNRNAFGLMQVCVPHTSLYPTHSLHPPP